MKSSSIPFVAVMLFCELFALHSGAQETIYHEPYRPQLHFSPQEHWINDPNGMVYFQGTYHLFFQYHPYSTTWGPMHWGHATSRDLVHWEQQPIALYPDSLGYIFSGSAVIDQTNSSGLGSLAHPPMVAIYTSHNPKATQDRDREKQSIAYSLDRGQTWVKYPGNPVLDNPGISDFRDPKVMWYEAGRRWIMTLATKDRVTFYSSPDLKHWKKESEFGSGLGAHGGVWECPDLFSLPDGNRTVWVLLVNLNPGGPNKGSSTQYFTGDFDGHQFTPFSTRTKWLDYGPDEYAGVTFSNTGNRRILIGWMTNWLYANQVPTLRWRSAMTLPRELKLMHTREELLLASQPVAELSGQALDPLGELTEMATRAQYAELTGIRLPARLDLGLDSLRDFSVTLTSPAGDSVVIGYQSAAHRYYIDRTHSGKVDFQPDFAARHFAPRLSESANLRLTLFIDVASVELFADDGLTVMTETFFPREPLDKIALRSEARMNFNKVEFRPYKGIWK